jgi:hypothetical protein
LAGEAAAAVVVVVAAEEVGGAEFVVGLAAGEDVVDADEDGVGDGGGRLFVSAAAA